MPKKKHQPKGKTDTPKVTKVTVTKVPTIKCGICRQPFAVLKGQNASKILTDHYRKKHS